MSRLIFLNCKYVYDHLLFNIFQLFLQWFTWHFICPFLPFTQSVKKISKCSKHSDTFFQSSWAIYTSQILAFVFCTFFLCTSCCHGLKCLSSPEFQYDCHLIWNHFPGASDVGWLMFRDVLSAPVCHLYSNPYYHSNTITSLSPRRLWTFWG